MLASLLKWAREERLLGGQRDRWEDRFRVKFRNYTARSEYHRGVPDDAASEIFHLSEPINQIWGLQAARLLSGRWSRLPGQILPSCMAWLKGSGTSTAGRPSQVARVATGRPGWARSMAGPAAAPFDSGTSVCII
jgi:hypothetical protein